MTTFKNVMSNRLFLLVSTIATAGALASAGCTKTPVIKGQIVDKVCYLGDPRANRGDNHPGMASDCATTCAQKGSALAVVTDDGALYEITGEYASNNNAKRIPHIAHVVEITGPVSEQYGEWAIAARDLKRLDR